MIVVIINSIYWSQGSISISCFMSPMTILWGVKDLGYYTHSTMSLLRLSWQRDTKFQSQNSDSCFELLIPGCFSFNTHTPDTYTLGRCTDEHTQVWVHRSAHRSIDPKTGSCNNVFHCGSSKTHLSKAVRLHKLPEKEGKKNQRISLTAPIKWNMRWDRTK